MTNAVPEGDTETEAEILSALVENTKQREDLIQKLGRCRANRNTAIVPTFGAYASSLIQNRELFGRYVDGTFFSDPAFDMLLDLFVASERGEVRRVKSCILAARVPATTAMRYLELMQKAGLTESIEDPADGRVRLVRLRHEARRRVREWLRATSPIPLQQDQPAPTF